MNLKSSKVKEKILETAIEFIRCRSYEEITISNIAKEANVSKETLKTHFRDRLTLLSEANMIAWGKLEEKYLEGIKKNLKGNLMDLVVGFFKYRTEIETATTFCNVFRIFLEDGHNFKNSNRSAHTPPAFISLAKAVLSKSGPNATMIDAIWFTKMMYTFTDIFTLMMFKTLNDDTSILIGLAEMQSDLERLVDQYSLQLNRPGNKNHTLG